MTKSRDTILHIRCSCSAVQYEAIGTPIVCAVCHCDDCQAGFGQIEALPNAAPVRDADGGTPFVLYRKDRMHCTQGGEHLRDYRLKPASPTRRVVASCCNAGMFLDFEKGHWYSICQGRFEGTPPPMQMRLNTKFRTANTPVPTDLPSSSMALVRFVAKLMTSKLAMTLGR
jgi:hypothetical protein